VLGFFRRRAQRILPAYYFGLVGLVGLFWIVPTWNEFDGTHRDLALPALDGAVIASHLLLVHNFSAEWIWKLNGPLWSVAVEWQLYGLFPLLILIFRRFGANAGSAVGLGLGYALTALLLCVDAPLATRTCPWYLGLFAIGIAAAVRVQDLATRPAPRMPWLGQAACWLALAFVTDATLPTQLGVNTSMLIDPMIAQALVCVLFHCNSLRSAGTERRSRLQAALEHPWLLRLGAFSYSLYLVHDPVLSFIVRGMVARGLSEELRLWATFFVAVPVATLYAYAFYCVAEKPFLPRRPVRDLSVLRSSGVHAKPVASTPTLTQPADRTAAASAWTRGRELP
jgi:peptidoglycan/LPS O-acetylase OafA/YrhL